ncbi:BQ2448_5367 [Microbotryum intermedium]|uniref:BQ2448_5367 protein n=1 Tax=Microbotryum intermedium TaxID=269621 RepID=A0A238F9J9_9BASI|nr:BQ2448_5367 [Microbotryum intermedium]
MSLTNDTNKLFQSDAQHAQAAYRVAKAQLHETTGDPIKLSTVPLRVVVRQHPTRGPEAWVAESGFVVRRLDLESGRTWQLYRGHLGPVTSLDFYTPPAASTSTSGKGKSRQLMISGSWDKSVRVWDTTASREFNTVTKSLLSTTIAHIDFVKSLVVVPELKLLCSGSSDKDIRVWDLSVLDSWDFDSTDRDARTSFKPEDEVENEAEAEPATGNNTEPQPTLASTGAAPPAAKNLKPLPFLLSLKSHTRPIERLAYYRVLAPRSNDTSESNDEDDADAPRERTGSVALISVDSLGALKVWELWSDEQGQLRGELRSDTRPHEIGIYDLVIGDGEIWTASADNSVLLSTFDASSPSSAPIPTTRIVHPYHLKSVLPLGIALPNLNSSHLLTGSADEAIRILDLNSISSSSHPPFSWSGIPSSADEKMVGLVRTVEGHSHDVVDLHVYTQVGPKEQGGRIEAWILSASVDGTLRRWKWPEVLIPPSKEEEKVLVDVKEEEAKGKSLLTAEEEAELEALMADE